MPIAVISDTHLEAPTEALHRIYEEHLAGADAVLHCGDVVGEATLAFLQAHSRFFGVRGNMDFGTVGSHLPLTRVVRFNGCRIGMVHNPGWVYAPTGRNAWSASLPEDLDLICCGHTHERMWTVARSGVRLLNPGSLFSPRDDRGGLAMLHLDGGDVQVRWIDVPSP